MQLAPSPEPVAPSAPAGPGCLHYLLFALAATWIMAIVALVQGGAWLYDQIAQTRGQPASGIFWLLLGAGQALLLAAPVVPLALLTRAPRLRATYITWALAIGLGALFSLPRL